MSRAVYYKLIPDNGDKHTQLVKVVCPSAFIPNLIVTVSSIDSPHTEHLKLVIEDYQKIPCILSLFAVNPGLLTIETIYQVEEYLIKNGFVGKPA